MDSRMKIPALRDEGAALNSRGPFLGRAIAFALVLTLAIVSAPRAHAGSANEAERLEDARTAFQSLFEIPDSSVPGPLLRECRGVAIFPGIFGGAIGFGARRGHGVISVRDSAGHWSPPSFLTLTGGSYGLQIGVQKTQLILFFMNEASVRSLIRSRFTLGAKAGVAAGPVGRSAEGSTDIKLDAEIYSYARSKGLFAGISIEGAKVATDTKGIRNFYGAALTPEAILFEHKVPRHPQAAQRFTQALPGRSGEK